MLLLLLLWMLCCCVVLCCVVLFIMLMMLMMLMLIIYVGHVSAAIDEYRMLMFGGRSANGGYLSDSWIYDLTRDNWTPIPDG